MSRLRVLAVANWDAKKEPDTEISVAVGKMLSKRINCLPVIDDANNLCGIITSTDFLKTLRSVQKTSTKEIKSCRD